MFLLISYSWFGMSKHSTGSTITSSLWQHEYSSSWRKSTPTVSDLTPLLPSHGKAVPLLHCDAKIHLNLKELLSDMKNRTWGSKNMTLYIVLWFSDINPYLRTHGLQDLRNLFLWGLRHQLCGNTPNLHPPPHNLHILYNSHHNLDVSPQYFRFLLSCQHESRIRMM